MLGGPRVFGRGAYIEKTFDVSGMIHNTIYIELDFYQIEKFPEYFELYTNGMLFFTYFYYCECVIKLTGLADAYFKDAW